MQIPLGWAEQQFRAMGRRDARDLAVELVASYQGSAVLTSALGQPELMAPSPTPPKMDRGTPRLTEPSPRSTQPPNSTDS
jgi:hypothetical protein